MRVGKSSKTPKNTVGCENEPEEKCIRKALLHSFNHVFNCHAVRACVGIQPAPQQYNLPPTTRQMCVCVRACVGIQPCVPEASRQGHINLRVHQSWLDESYEHIRIPDRAHDS